MFCLNPRPDGPFPPAIQAGGKGPWNQDANHYNRCIQWNDSLVQNILEETTTYPLHLGKRQAVPTGL
jgi:hypothetical protein